MNISLNEIAKEIDGVVVGDGTIVVHSIAPLESALEDSLVWADNEAYFDRAELSSARAILTNLSMKEGSKPSIRVRNPKLALISILKLFHPEKALSIGIHETAVLGDNVTIHKNVYIGPYVVIGRNSIVHENTRIESHVALGQDVEIGESSVIYPKVTVYDGVKIGNRVQIHAGAVVGSDGFGYVAQNGEHLKIPHAGTVVIEDDVEIGANTTIDRATLGMTRIGKGTKIDNLVQIAHSVKLGEHNILCAFTGIAGSSTSGDRVIFAADVGVGDHVRIDNDVVLGPRTGVPSNKHLKSGIVYLGAPARPKDKALEHELGMTRLPHMRKHLKALASRVDELFHHLGISEKKDAQ